MKLLSEKKKDKRNPRDIQYDSLNCTLEPYNRSDDEYKMVDEYLQNTNVGELKRYEMTIENVFKMTREEDEKRFKRKLGNRMLLWHGARLTDWCGILKEGLRVPSEKLRNCWLFGRGISFADMVPRAAMLCNPSKLRPTGFMMLCEVALGKVEDTTQNHFDEHQPAKGKHSRRAVGAMEPDPAARRTLPCGTVVPLGTPKTTTRSYLDNSEYIIFDSTQIRPRFLVQIHFKAIERQTVFRVVHGEGYEHPPSFSENFA